MYRKKIKLKTACVFIFILFINMFFVSCNTTNTNKDIIVEKWDNFMTAIIYIFIIVMEKVLILNN